MEKPSPTRVYIWDRSFLLQAGTFVLSKHSKPYRRPSATVLIAKDKPFVLKTNHGVRRQYQAVLVAPFVLRQSLVAEESALTIVDAGITSAAFRQLQPRLVPQQVLEITGEELEKIRGYATAASADLSCAEAKGLFDRIVTTLSSGAPGPGLTTDPQILELLAMVENAPMSQPVETLMAEKTGQPAARLRKQFSDAVGCSPVQFQRWLLAWKTSMAWADGMTLEQAAAKAGVDDLDAVDYAINELFGMSAANIFNSERIKFRNCSSGC